jgi:hypothetical protein
MRRATSSLCWLVPCQLYLLVALDIVASFLIHDNRGPRGSKGWCMMLCDAVPSSRVSTTISIIY